MFAALCSADIDRKPDEGNYSSALAETDSTALIEKQIQSIIRLEPVGMEFYEAMATKVGKVGGSGCLMGALAGALVGTVAAGPLGAGAFAVKGCAYAGFVSGLIAAIDSPFVHWRQATKAAYRARKAYTLSFVWLNIDAFDVIGADASKVKSIVNKKYRACAKRYHPDKLPNEATEKHRESASTKFANCMFAKAYIVAFQRAYGTLDPEDQGEGARKFLEDFAGVWASKFGTTETITDTEAEQWIHAVRHHTEL